MTEGSFEEFYAATYLRLLKQLVLVTGDAGDAEDLLQEAYARAAVRWKHLRDYDRPEAWVRRVALHLAADAARRARRRAAALLRLRLPPPVELSPDSLDLAKALRALSLGQRQAVVLYHLVGLSVQEVAEQLGVPVGTVKARLARGRAALARRLTADELEVLHDDR
ncbi:MAG TPA: sigma-70 family RNA polymerase sigma factor [Actinomycetes bacterium]